MLSIAIHYITPPRLRLALHIDTLLMPFSILPPDDDY
jgi:hypothetical protein